MANTSKRGFASMDPSKQREIASKGGKAAHAKGTAHEFTSDEARVAGRKGGEAVSRDRVHMSAIGREGGHSRGARARASQAPGRSATSDFTREAGDQAFDRQVTSERSAYEPANRSGSSGQQRGYSSTRSERQGDTPSNTGPFSSRDAGNQPGDLREERSPYSCACWGHPQGRALCRRYHGHGPGPLPRPGPLQPQQY